MVRTQRAVLSLPEGVKRRKISRSEEGSSAKPVAFPLGMDSACASNTPSDESQSSGAGVLYRVCWAEAPRTQRSTLFVEINGANERSL